MERTELVGYNVETGGSAVNHLARNYQKLTAADQSNRTGRKMQPGKNRHGWITDVETSYQFFKEGNSANVLRDRPNFLGEFSSSAGEKRQQSLVSQPNISFSSLIFFFSCKQYALSE